MSKKIEMRKCAVCGKKFTPKAVNQTYCSKECKNAAKRKAEKAKKEAVKKHETAKKPVAKTVKAKVVEKIKLAEKPTKTSGKKEVKTISLDPQKSIVFCVLAILEAAAEIRAMCEKPKSK